MFIFCLKINNRFEMFFIVKAINLKHEFMESRYKKSQCFDQNIIVHCKNNQESLNIFKTNQLCFFF